VQNVLDVGCGTGIWSIEFADEHPSARVLGTDLSPIQPAQVPPNCEFLIDDCEQDWIFHHQFDYIHTRALVAAVKDWDRFFEQAYANLKPGGYLECQDVAFPIRCLDPGVTAENSPLIRWSELFIEAAKKIGVDGTGPRHFTPKLRNAGFVNVNLKMHKWPVGKWAKGAKFKLLGRYVYEDLMDWLPSSSLRLFTRVLKWSREELEVFLSQCRAEARRKDRHYYADA
jgi:SAM-dependent methyltransferase